MRFENKTQLPTKLARGMVLWVVTHAGLATYVRRSLIKPDDVVIRTNDQEMPYIAYYDIDPCRLVFSITHKLDKPEPTVKELYQIVGWWAYCYDEVLQVRRRMPPHDTMAWCRHRTGVAFLANADRLIEHWSRTGEP